jgi:biofilm PGA synthesis N-glycosyltransferase PgaC
VFYRLVFVLFIDITKLFATVEEFMDVQMSWGKLERLGRIT